MRISHTRSAAPRGIPSFDTPRRGCPYSLARVAAAGRGHGGDPQRRCPPGWQTSQSGWFSSPSASAATRPASASRSTSRARIPSQGFLAVDHIDLDVNEGEFFSLLGPSGCGKTTTLRMIGGFEQPTEGTIELQGEDVTWLPAYKRQRQHGLPELRPLPAPDHLRERRLRAAPQEGRRTPR